MKEAFIELKGLTKNFDSQQVLKGIDLTIYRNEFLTLLGPSGCGKTTTRMKRNCRELSKRFWHLPCRLTILSFPILWQETAFPTSRSLYIIWQNVQTRRSMPSQRLWFLWLRLLSFWSRETSTCMILNGIPYQQPDIKQYFADLWTKVKAYWWADAQCNVKCNGRHKMWHKQIRKYPLSYLTCSYDKIV